MSTRLIPLDEALLKISQELDSTSLSVDVANFELKELYGKILAEDIVSEVNVPPANNSAMDGFVINSADFSGGEQVRFSQYLTAGSVAKNLHKGEVARIFTGAELPSNADTVIAQENCFIEGDIVTLPEIIETGANVRFGGQDVEKGQKVFSRGRRLSAQDVGMLASLGINIAKCFLPLKVGLLATGNELLEPGQQLAPGKIYNSNQYLLDSLLKRAGYEVIWSKVVSDNLDETVESFRQLAQSSDVILSSGGVSVGDSDFVKQAVERLGELRLWNLALKPGKPFSFGHIGNTYFFGLPGNPVAVFVTFLFLVRKALFQLQGQREFEKLISFPVKANFSLKANSKRLEFLRVSLVRHSHNQQQMLELFPNQSSGVLSSICFSDGFAKVEPGHSVTEGDFLEFIPLNQFF